MNPCKRIRLRSLPVLLCLMAGVASQVRAAAQTIRNDRFWKDVAGNTIYSQGGGVFKFGSTWYWYGVHYAGAETYAANPSKLNSDTRFVSVTCYSSTDLVNWKFERNVIDSGDAGISGSTWFGRLGVAYNKTSKKYVLLAQRNGASGNGELFATSSTPDGKFAFDHIQTKLPNVTNGMSGDQTVFVDDDGKAYLVLSSMSGRAYLYVAPLRASDYLNVESAIQIAKTPGREGNCMFKHRGRYYFASSDLHGWNSSHAYLQSSTSILGPYSTETVMGGTDRDFSHVSQTGFFFRVDGSKDTTVVFAGDRWSDFAGNGLGYNQWVPLSFDGTAPSMNSLSEWTLDASTGSWAVGEGNNWILNPSFEADRVSQAALAGWTDSTNRTAFPGGNIAGGHTGRWALNFYDAQAYVGKKSQVIAGLPNGTYALSAWVRSSGGQKSCAVYARTSEGGLRELSAASAISDWKQLSTRGILVTDGRIEVGVRTDANAGNWARVDDIELVRQTSIGVEPSAATAVPPRWTVSRGSVQVELPEGGELSLSTLDGRALRRVAGRGLLRLPIEGYGVFVARVRGSAVRFEEARTVISSP